MVAGWPRGHVAMLDFCRRCSITELAAAATECLYSVLQKKKRKEKPAITSLTSNTTVARRAEKAAAGMCATGQYSSPRIVLIDVSAGPWDLSGAYGRASLPLISRYLSIRREDPPDRAFLVDQQNRLVAVKSTQYKIHPSYWRPVSCKKINKPGNLQIYRIVLFLRSAAAQRAKRFLFPIPAPDAQNAGNASVTSRKFFFLSGSSKKASREKVRELKKRFRSLWATCMTVTMTASGARLLLLALCVYRASALQQSAAPRVRLSFKELMDTRAARPFSFSFNTSDYRILLMDQDQGRLYLGSREYLVALDMQNVNKEPLIGECANFVRMIEPWNRTHLYTCGTGAYQPICTFINRGWRAEDYLFRLVPGYVDSGKGKCSYDPKQENIATLINGNLYAGVHIDFMSTDAALFRTMGGRTAIRTEQYDSRWLNEPVFVQIQQIPDSAERNDDKLYFFFREKSLDSSNGASPSVLARVGRVCLNDEGGQKSLVNRWTTFLKARLICSVIGEDGVETRFDELRDVFIQPTQDERNPMVYALFTTAGALQSVCTPWLISAMYSMDRLPTNMAIITNGQNTLARFLTHGLEQYVSGHVISKVMQPCKPQTDLNMNKPSFVFPVQCPGGTFTPGIRSSKNFSDEAVNFIRAHPLMFHPVYPIHRRPLVVRTGVDYRFTALVVDQVDAVDGRYEVLFLGTDRGTVQKVIVLPKDPTSMEELTLEEVEVFRTLTQGRVRANLILTSNLCRRRSRRQDVKHGDPLRQCRGFNAKVEKRLRETVQFGVEGSSTFLECQPRSPQATVKWLFQREGKRKLTQGSTTASPTENNFKHTVARVALRILDRDIVLALTDQDEDEGPKTRQAGPYVQSSVVSTPFPPEIRLINQYCQSYWEQLSPKAAAAA
ncbi:Semaphorin-3F Sema III/F [Collichthys lucidus]|uniref:Semaphorin-3F Sema III/F n=1 Tax=Collichthys lucidus TaxID=240159 RepID=A0A4U5UNY3_COLLU|nr:Semaphorin-3F Sema III/F [Collichthys lucidus]